jgi:hypothetical protein
VEAKVAALIERGVTVGTPAFDFGSPP